MSVNIEVTNNSGAATKESLKKMGLNFTETRDKVTISEKEDDSGKKFEAPIKPSKVKFLKEKFERFIKRVELFYQKIKDFFDKNKEKSLEEEVDEIVRKKENTSDIVEEKKEKEEDTSNIVEEEKDKKSTKNKKIKGGFINWLLVTEAKITAALHARAIKVPEGVISKYAKIDTSKIPSLEERFEAEKEAREAEMKAIAEKMAANARKIDNLAGNLPKIDESNKENQSGMPVDEQSIYDSKKEKITNPIENSVISVSEVQKKDKTPMEQAKGVDIYSELQEKTAILEAKKQEAGQVLTKKELTDKELEQAEAEAAKTEAEERKLSASILEAEEAARQAEEDFNNAVKAQLEVVEKTTESITKEIVGNTEVILENNGKIELVKNGINNSLKAISTNSEKLAALEEKKKKYISMKESLEPKENSLVSNKSFNIQDTAQNEIDSMPNKKM